MFSSRLKVRKARTYSTIPTVARWTSTTWVRSSAKIVDRMPSNDLKSLLAGLKAGHVRFDDYCGIFETGIGPNVNRMWRKGRKWRVELLLPDPKKPQEFPKDADAAWWKQHQGDFTFMVQAICDGEKSTITMVRGTRSRPMRRGHRV